MKIFFKLIISISYYIYLMPCFAMESSSSIVDIWKLETGDVLHAYITVCDFPYLAHADIYVKSTIIGFRSDGYVVLEYDSKEFQPVRTKSIKKMAVAKKLNHPYQIGELVYFDTDRTGTVE